MNSIEYEQKIMGLESDIEYLEDDLRKSEDKREKYRLEINKSAEYIQFLVKILDEVVDDKGWTFDLYGNTGDIEEVLSDTELEKFNEIKRWLVE